VRDKVWVLVGWALIIAGSALGVCGGIANAISLHDFAIDIWVVSNALLFVWAVGYVKKYWNTRVSIEVLAVLYAIYEIQNIYAILVR
jgi:hypothetical protein